MSEPVGTSTTTDSDGSGGQPQRDAGVGQAQAQSAGQLEGRRASLWGDAWRELRHSPLFVVSALLMTVFLLMAVFPRLFTSRDPFDCQLARSRQAPSADAWFGYDIQGCDYYTRVVYGARVSISIGVIVTLAAVVIAVILGSLAGYYGGIIDTLIARATDIIFGLPTVLGAIVILSVVSERNLFWVSVVLIVLGWPTMTRLMRSSVIGVRDMDYVKAAKALGATDFRLLSRHALPNAMAPMIVYATIYVGIIVAAEATLSFLGIGLQLPAISWGLMVSVAQTRILTEPHLLFFPGLFLSLTVLSFILMGDALRDALDPKLR